MPTVTRVMNDGKVDLTGRTVNGLRVERMTQRQPLRYAVKCETCSATTSESHERLIHGAAKCRNANCGKIDRKQERLIEAERIADEARYAAEEADRAARLARMEADTADYVRPERYAPKPPEHLIMSERERLSIREHQQAEEAEQAALDAPRLQAEAEAAEQIAQVEEQFKETASNLARVQREQIATGKDDQFVIDPATCGTGIPTKEVATWQSSQYTQFLTDNPEFHQCPENAEAISSYLARNTQKPLKLISAKQLGDAFRRLSEYGLLKSKPAPERKPLERPQHINLDFAPEPIKPVTEPKTYKGRDYATGLEREFTEREINRMGSLEFQRAFEVIPTVSELFTQLSEAR